MKRKQQSFQLSFLCFIDRLLESRLFQFIKPPKNENGIVLSRFVFFLLKLRRLGKVAALNSLTPEQSRERWLNELLPLQANFPIAEVRRLTIPTSAGDLEARLYIPVLKEKLPALMAYFHGGGFVFGDLETADDSCRLLCQESGIPLLSVSYRLAPENPFPAAVEDAEAAVRWVQRNADLFGVVPSNVVVGGNSAGATLAAVTVQNLALTGSPVFAQCLIYPMVDRAGSYPSHQRYDHDFYLNYGEREWFYKHYLQGTSYSARDPRISPIQASGLPPLAPALVVTAGFDILRDEGSAYAKFLHQLGGQVKELCAESLAHGFLNLVSIHGESREMTREIGKSLRELVQSHLPSRS